VLKRRLTHLLRVMRSLRTWQIVLLAFGFSVASLIALRANSLEAVKYFDAVKQADKEGNDVGAAVARLQHFVTTHMNTDLERVTLDQTYERDYQKALTDYQSSGSVGGDPAYQVIIKHCEDLYKGTGSYVIIGRCVQNGIDELPTGQAPESSIKAPLKDRYEFHFVSPQWSFDLAGLIVLITALLWIILVFKILLQLILMLMIRTHRGKTSLDR
jgi:hypothetical protein